MGTAKSEAPFQQHEVTRQASAWQSRSELSSSSRAAWHLGKQGTGSGLLKVTRSSLCCIYIKTTLKILFYGLNVFLEKKLKRWQSRSGPFTGALGTMGQEGGLWTLIKHMQSAGGRVLPLLGKGGLASRHATSQTYKRLADTWFSRPPHPCLNSWGDPDVQPGWRAQRARHFSVSADPWGSC